MLVILRNFVKLQDRRQLFPKICLMRLKSTCEGGKKMSPERKKFKALQAKMQRDIHAPVFLIMGTRDKILYYFTLGLIGSGLIYSFYILYFFSKRPP